jgi:hypothetical protein
MVIESGEEFWTSRSDNEAAPQIDEFLQRVAGMDYDEWAELGEQYGDERERPPIGFKPTIVS